MQNTKQTRKQQEARTPPPAGPHGKEKLIDREKTPGTGSLADEKQPEADVGPD